MRSAAAITIALLLCLSVPAAAQTNENTIPATLERQGYRIVQIHWTLLGRIRIVAETDEVRREIVVSPDNGEILRDYAITHAELKKRRARDRRPPGVETTAAGALDGVDTPIGDPID